MFTDNSVIEVGVEPVVETITQVQTRRVRVSGMKVYGVGENLPGKFCSSEIVDGKKVSTWEYSLWAGMLERSYSRKFKDRCPAYEDASCDSQFHSFQDFCAWLTLQVGYREAKFQLDKDLLVRGNKMYSPDTCLLLPATINSILLKSDSSRGEFPLGVTFNKAQGMFVARYSVKGISVYLGRYSTIPSAFSAYKVAKEKYIKEYAELWKDKIDIRAYQALMRHVVEVTD